MTLYIGMKNHENGLPEDGTTLVLNFGVNLECEMSKRICSSSFNAIMLQWSRSLSCDWGD